MKTPRFYCLMFLLSLLTGPHGIGAEPSLIPSEKGAVENAKSYLQIISGAACGASGHQQMLRNSHPSKTIEATVIVLMMPGGRGLDMVVSVAPEKLQLLGCSKMQSTAVSPAADVTYAIANVRFK